MTVSEISSLGRASAARSGTSRPALMSVSVVICAYTMDRWDALVAAVKTSLAQSTPPDEVLVVIDYNEELYRRCV